MSMVVEGYIFAIVGINSGCGDDWTTKVTANVFSNNFGITSIGLDIIGRKWE